jgi:hypothetical protein
LYGAIQSSAKAGSDAAKAAITQAEATKAEAKSVEGQTAAVNQSLIATKDMASATRDAAKAGEHGNDIANRAYLAAERPWVGVDAINPDGTPQAGKDFKIVLTVRNNGHSPALAARASFTFPIVHITAAILPNTADCAGQCSASTLLPNGATTYTPVLDKTELTADEVKRLTDNTDTILLTGRIDYTDDTGANHTTMFCNWWNGKIGQFSSCTSGNTAN